ncbi:biotin--[acetyl-CoA-carboxylase] ligase [Natronosalvus halobius]|uniref:biotin--[acetyl-CoA-carboxylase] ligase n=1 Tax=Natronosalvus halobius TaxID=2953746 RepID=UPI00209F7306|nr:biotin--[acetyl-CoA-carboxylase] ligase [Natronosalvus halobius]USZ72150.1 biotin--[acetyl-CoA-carboxylase] ligase [Natronosalvus halobius]
MNDTRRAVLEALADGPVSGPGLAAELECSRAAVWKHVEALRDAGFDVESTGSGYVLGGDSIDAYSGPAIEYGLEAPFEVEYHETLASTNDRARELAGNGEADVAVIADEQTGGRGRLDRPWVGPRGGVWLSILCRPEIPPARAPLYTLAAAVATARAAREAGVDAAIKWPNDVIVPGDGDDYRKLAGILTEMEGETDRVAWLVVGIGINANLEAVDLPEVATSISDEAEAVDRRRFVQRVLEAFDEYRSNLDAVIPAWRELAATPGQRVRVAVAGTELVGRAVDVDEHGALKIATDEGERTVTTGDCEHLRPVE